MTFHSFQFVFLFLPFVASASRALASAGKNSIRVLLLLVASLVFYSLASWQTLPILLGSFVSNAVVCRRVAAGDQGVRRHWLVAGIGLNLFVLGVFKYSRFVVENLAALSGHSWNLPAFTLPLGISFFSLQQIMYLVDCYEGMSAPAPLCRHALLICFFPYVSAGPLVHGGEFLEQLDAHPMPGQTDRGLARFVVGLAKKVVVADLCGKLADAMFDGPVSPGLLDGWIGAIAFTLQLYFDFGGYSDMAMGVAELLGLELPQNFDAPLRSKTVIEFWTRWHITLSKFITTYLYTPLVKSLRPITFYKSMVVTLVAMTLAGLWHGAAWTFVAFGAAHGVALVTNHVWRKRKKKIPAPIAQGMTTLFVICSFVVFRARSLGSAFQVLAGMSGFHGKGVFSAAFAAISRPEQAVCLSGLAAGIVIVLVAPSSATLFKAFRPNRNWSIACAVLAVVAFLLMNASAPKGFIYRDF